MFTQAGCGATGFLVRTGPLDPFFAIEINAAARKPAGRSAP